ncbi:hypothetical protein ABH935_005389 [Catenulispora sp. GAS73]|uniref:hypothetical protein n=1 Tax=Catenulispora sp. GAS73 TaxID=3156269 RepID=UPI003518DF9F
MYYLAAAYTVHTTAAREWLHRQLTAPDRDRGNIPEGVIWMAGFALMALIVVGIISLKVVSKAHSINLDGNAGGDPAQ